MSQSLRKSRFIGSLVVALTLLSFLAAGIGSTVRHVSAQGDVVFEDSFDDNTNNWKSMSTSSCKVTVGGGQLTLSNTKANSFCAATPDQTLADDITVQVTATPGDGVANWDLGVILRADARNTDSAFYQFGVISSGRWYFAIRTAKGDKYDDKDSGTLKVFDATQPVSIKVVAAGTNFTFFVGDEQVGQWDDDSINNDPSTEKYVGLILSNSKTVSKASGSFSELSITSGGEASSEPTATPTKPSNKKPTATPKGSTKKTPTPTAEPTEESQNGDALLADQFNDNSNDWVTSSTVSVADGALTIEVTKENVIKWTTPSQKLPADIDVTVTITNPDPDSSGAWDAGVGIRGYTEGTGDKAKERFYLFDVKGDGTAALYAQNGADISKTIVKPTKIKGYDPTADNTLRFVAKGSKFDLYVNDVKVASGTDTSLKKQSSYTLYLVAGTFKGVTSSTVKFSNLVVNAAQ